VAFRLKLLILILFVLIYFVEKRLSVLSNFLYPEKSLKQDEKIAPAWDKTLGKKIKTITQRQKEEQKKKKKAKEDKWLKAHPPRAFLTIPQIKSRINLDGRLDEELWRAIPGTTPFTHYKEHAFSKVLTYSRVCYDRNNLYIGFHCAEPGMQKIRAKIRKHDGDVWTDDSVEVFISPGEEKRKDYYHFVLNTLGIKYEAYKSNSSWNGKWKGMVFAGETEWEAELAIPFRTLALRGAKLGRILPVNFNRSRYVNEKEYSNWAYTGGSFHKPDRFGRIMLGWDAPFLNRVFWDTSFGKATLSAEVVNPLNSGKALELKLVTVKQKKPLIEEGFLEAGKKEEFKISFAQPDPVSADLQLSLYEKGRELLFYATPHLPLSPEKAFIRSWLICGPFPNPGGRKKGEAANNLRKIKCRGFNVDFLVSQGGELKIEPQKGMRQVYKNGPVGKEYRHSWQVKKSPSAMVDFYKMLDPYEYIIVYAAAYIISGRDTDALIKLGSDDGYKLWVNHELMGENHIHRGSAPDQNVHSVKLKRGKNLILIKIDQDYGGVNFYLRLTDSEGKPLSGIKSVIGP
jgi:hypothetical protein